MQDDAHVRSRQSVLSEPSANSLAALELGQRMGSTACWPACGADQSHICHIHGACSGVQDRRIVLTPGQPSRSSAQGACRCKASRISGQQQNSTSLIRQSLLSARRTSQSRHVNQQKTSGPMYAQPTAAARARQRATTSPGRRTTLPSFRCVVYILQRTQLKIVELL
jgi:hypothetical protein